MLRAFGIVVELVQNPRGRSERFGFLGERVAIFCLLGKLLLEPASLLPILFRRVISSPGRKQFGRLLTRVRRGLLWEWNGYENDVEGGVIDGGPGANFAPH